MEKVTRGRREVIKTTVKEEMQRKKKFQYALIGEGILIGAVVGAVISLFRMSLVYADEARQLLVKYAHTGITGGIAAVAVLILLAFIITRLLKWDPDIAGSGIPQIEGELKGMKDMVWWRVVLSKIIGCTLAIGGGLALGREGPSIQIGAMVGKGYARLTRRVLTEERILLTCGAGAGLSAAFGAPLAGSLFVLEELHRNFSGEMLFSTMAACVTSDFVSANVFGLEPVFGITVDHSVPLRYYGLVMIMAVILGFFGMFYNRTIAFMQDAFGKASNTFIKLMIAFGVCLVFMYVYPTALGSGNDLVSEICEGRYALAALAIMLLIKFLFSTMSFGSGSPGGIFLPLLVLGAITGGLYARVCQQLFGIPDECIAGFVVVAMAGYFAAIVQAPITGTILITEMTGDFTSLLPLVFASLISFLVADFFGGKPIYHQLLERMSNQKKIVRKDRKSIIEAEVHMGSYMDGRRILEFGLPLGTLIVSVVRGETEIIPDGQTILRGGDELEILIRDSEIDDAQKLIDARAKHVDPHF